MRLGLIARCDMARGLAVQGKNFYDHMPVDKVLCVRMPRPDSPECPEWYANRTDALYDMRGLCLDESVVIPWLRDLDVVFCVETPHDWRVPTWCREQGVKLVVQGNPEFVRHGIEDRPHPDEWWWPSSWRLDVLPEGRVMPVPMNRVELQRSDDPRLHVLHVIGKRAFGDRNGTELLAQAMRMVHVDVKLTIHSIDGDLPTQFPQKRNIEYSYQLDPVEDLWSMYDDQDVLVLPRRYGGLSLPAVEATAAGLVVAMSACSPNQELAAVMLHGRTRTQLNMACGSVPAWESSPSGIADMITRLANLDPIEVDELRAKQRALLLTWDEGAPLYMKAFEELL